MRTALARLLLGCFGILLALTVAEVALRVLPLPRLRPPSVMVPNPVPTWRDSAWGTPPDSAFRPRYSVDHEHVPDLDIVIPLAEHPGGSFHMRTNNLGLRRDEDTQIDKSPDLYRVLVLGDSHTDGYVENSENFSTLLEQTLSGRLAEVGKRLEVLNGGVMGYSPAQEYYWYHAHGLELKPDLVVVVFYAGNDVVEILKQPSPRVDPATGRAVPPVEDFPTDSSDPLGDLRLGLLARYTVQVGPLADTWSRLGLPGRQTEITGYTSEMLTQALTICYGCFYQSVQQAHRFQLDPERMQDTIVEAAGTLVRLRRDVRQNGGKLAVALLPTAAQVEPDRDRQNQVSVATVLGVTEASLAFEDRTLRDVNAQLAAAGVPAISLLEPLRAARESNTVGRAGQQVAQLGATSPGAPGPAEALYYSKDWHLNPRGHQVVAQALASGLESAGLLPGRSRVSNAQSAPQGAQSDDRRGQ